MDLSLFNQNVKLLEKQDTALANRIRTLPEEVSYNVIPAKKGFTALLRAANNAEIFLHSKYDPFREAQQITASANISPTADLICLGFGLGYHIIEVLKLEAKRDFILIIEKNLSLIHAAFHYIDYTFLLTDKRVIWSVDEEPPVIFNRLRNFSLQILANGLSFLEHNASIQCVPFYYDAAKKAVTEIFTWAKVNVNTQLSKAENFSSNIIKNSEIFVQSPGIGELKNKAKNVPAFIVSAGPSLDKNIFYLKLVKEKALIFAVDSAVKALIDNGIKPDFVISIDFGEKNLRHMKGFDTEDLTLIFDPEVHPEIPAGFKGQKICINLPGKGLCDWTTSVIGDKGGLEKGLSVAHTAFFTAEYMGCSPIIFIGQDLAHPRGAWHTKGSDMFQQAGTFSDIRKRKTSVEGYYGGTETSETSLKVFLNHFESILSGSNKTVFNATEGGAKINGMKNISMRETAAVYCRKHIDKKNILEINGQCKEDLLLKFFNASMRVMRKLEECNHSSYKAFTRLESMLVEMQKPNWDKNILITKYSEIIKLVSEISADNEVLTVMKDNSADALLIRAKREMKTLKNGAELSFDELKRLFQKEHFFFKSLVKTSDFLAREFAEMLNSKKSEFKKG